MAKKIEKEETYNRSMSQLMSRLLFRYLRREIDLNPASDGYWCINLSKNVPEGALVVPFALSDAKQWWLGWYRGKDDDGYDLIESVETHKIHKFTNCGFLFLDNIEFASSPLWRYSDREWEIMDTIKKRVARHNYWFVVANVEFNEDGISVSIRKKFCDELCTKTYKNLKSCTIAALDKHCEECEKIFVDKK